jgi:hypothetical protein
VERPAVDEQGGVDIPLLSREEAIAEVRRWLDVEQVDPERIFSQMGDQIVRYKDLISHLDQDTPDGKLLRFAISRGRTMRQARNQTLQNLLQIAPGSPMPMGEGRPQAPHSSASPSPTE